MAENLANNDSNNTVNTTPNHAPRQYRIKRRLEAHQRIRQMLTVGYTHSQIKFALGLPERTYRRYVAEVFDRDERTILDNKAMAVETAQAIAVCIDQFTEQYRMVRLMAEDKTLPADKRLDAHHLLAQICIMLVKLRSEVPSVYIAKTGLTLSELARQFDNIRAQHDGIKIRNNNNDNNVSTRYPDSIIICLVQLKKKSGRRS